MSATIRTAVQMQLVKHGGFLTLYCWDAVVMAVREEEKYKRFRK